MESRLFLSTAFLWKFVFFSTPLIILLTSTNTYYFGLIISAGLLGLYLVTSKNINVYVGVYLLLVSITLSAYALINHPSTPVAYQSSIEFLCIYMF